jgi:hypothetical protein
MHHISLTIDKVPLKVYNCSTNIVWTFGSHFQHHFIWLYWKYNLDKNGSCIAL